MADPNQTQSRGEWVCPCSGCQKSVMAERKQLVELIKKIPGTESIIELIEDRNPKPKKKA
jgi:predicted RNA-binding protein YlxR (DUF448 family)